MTELLDLLEKKGVITSSEGGRIKDAVAEDLKRLDARERLCDEREKALEQREKAISKDSSPVSAPVSPPASQPEEKKEEASLPLKVKYEDGLWFYGEDRDSFALRLGGTLQTDYRYFDYGDVDPQKNKFDIRRARLLVMGTMLKNLDFRFLYEFQGTGSRNLLDAYVNIKMVPELNLRLGQFKQPFGFEQYSLDENLYFAERSMGWYLAPMRDVGAMYYGELWNGLLDCRLGTFNGDGGDDATGGEVDDPVLTGRLAMTPFKFSGIPLLEKLQVGGSFNWGRIGRNNVDIHVKTTGMTPILDVTSNAKYNIILKAGTQTRTGLEAAWAYGPFLLSTEYVRLLFKDVETSADTFDIPMKDFYVSLLWMITGEEPHLYHSMLSTMRPKRDLFHGGWGALGLAGRYDRFEASESIYETLVTPGDSIRKATAYSLALNWYLSATTRFILDGTRTVFDMPLKIYRDSATGISLYSDYENVLTLRFQLHF